MSSASDACRSGTDEHHAHLVDLLAHDCQGAQQRGSGDHGASMLVIMHHGNRHGLAQRFFNEEAIRRLDVFEIDATDSRLEKLAKLDDVFRFLRIHLQIENIDIRETFEEYRFPFHDWLSRQCTDVSQTENPGAIGDDRDQISSRGVLEAQLGRSCNLAARFRHSWRIGQTQVRLGTTRLGGDNLDLALAAAAVIIECILFERLHEETLRLQRRLR